MTIGPYCLYAVKTKTATLRRIKHVNAVVHRYPAPEQRATRAQPCVPEDT